MASALASLPIENSPPGIQTMPPGGGDAGCVVSGTVGANPVPAGAVERDPQAHWLKSAATAAAASTRRAAVTVTALLYIAVDARIARRAEPGVGSPEWGLCTSHVGLRTSDSARNKFDTHCMMSRVRGQVTKTNFVQPDTYSEELPSQVAGFETATGKFVFVT
jgi:hypothetical protein